MRTTARSLALVSSTILLSSCVLGPQPGAPDYPTPGAIRGDLGRDWGTPVQQNIVHGSDSPESAVREIDIWFPQL